MSSKCKVSAYSVKHRANKLMSVKSVEKMLTKRGPRYRLAGSSSDGSGMSKLVSKDKAQNVAKCLNKSIKTKKPRKPCSADKIRSQKSKKCVKRKPVGRPPKKVSKKKVSKK